MATGVGFVISKVLPTTYQATSIIVVQGGAPGTTYPGGPTLSGTEFFAIVGMIAFVAAAGYRLTRTYMARRQVLREGETV